jgi:hypothetical protein
MRESIMKELRRKRALAVAITSILIVLALMLHSFVIESILMGHFD